MGPSEGRRVGVSDADGVVEFVTIVPGCYSGRWPHLHFEVYASEAEALGGGAPVATSQIALPEAMCAAVYATSGYEQSVGNLAAISLDTDNVFSDGVDLQTPTVAGDVDGYTIELSVQVPM